MAAANSGFAAADQRYYSNTGTAQPMYLDLQGNSTAGASGSAGALLLPAGTSTTGLAANGEFGMYQKAGSGFLAFRLGGTTMVMGASISTGQSQATLGTTAVIFYAGTNLP